EMSELATEPAGELPLLLHEFSLVAWTGGGGGGGCCCCCCCWDGGGGWLIATGGKSSAIGDTAGCTIGCGTDGAGITAGGGILPPAETLPKEPFLVSQDIASMVTVGGRCFEV